MIELELQDLLTEKLREIFKDYSLLANNGTLQVVQVVKQFLPQPEGMTVRAKNSAESIVPQGYQSSDVSSIFPAIVVKVNGLTDRRELGLRKSTISAQIVVGTYDNSKDCQGYRDVFNILSRIRLELFATPGAVLGEKFRLSFPVYSTLLDDQEWPYFFGTIDLEFEAASPLNYNYI